MYNTRYFPNVALLKERLFTFRMNSSKTLTENVDEYQKLTTDISDIGEELDEQTLVVLLLNSIPKSHNSVTRDDSFSASRGPPLYPAN